MNEFFIFFLGVLYLITACFYLVREIFFVSYCNKLQLISIIRFMYSFVYGIIPCIILLRIYYNDEPNTRIDLSSNGICTLYVVYFFSLLAYFFLNFGYFISFKDKYNRKKITQGSISELDFRCLYVCGVLLLALSFFSIYMWTKTYGSVWIFIQNADLIRAGYGFAGYKNGFFKEFARSSYFAMFVFEALLLYENKMFRRAGELILFFVSVGCFVIFSLASDSRTDVGLVILCVAFMYIHFVVNKKNKKMVEQLIKLAFIIVFVFFSIIASEFVMNYIRFGDDMNLDKIDLFHKVQEEFIYVIVSQQYVTESMLNGLHYFKLFDDLGAALFAWFPSSFRPSEFSISLWAFNSKLQSIRWTWPTDLLTAGIYHVSWLGIFLTPFCFGLIVSFFENITSKLNDEMFKTVLYYGIAINLLHCVSHFQYSALVLMFFPVFIFVCLYFISKSIMYLFIKRK